MQWETNSKSEKHFENSIKNTHNIAKKKSGM